MQSKRWWIAGLVVAAAAAVAARAEEPTDAEKRTEAHRTVLRRLSESGGAKTKTLGLTPAASDLVDLYLDLARNQADARAGRAPRSRMFMGIAHGGMKVDGGKLVFEAMFVNLVIDDVKVPVAEVPALVAAALDPEKFRGAALPRDGAAIDGWRLNLLAEVVATVDGALAGTKGWPGLRDRAADALLAALPGSGGFEPYPALRCLQTIGDDRVAKALMAKAEALEDSLPRPRWLALPRTVFHMDTPVARHYAKEALKSGESDLVATALRALGPTADEETMAFVEKLLAPDSDTDDVLRRAAIGGLERQGTDRARKILERLFDAAPEGRERYSLACAATRSGSKKAIPYLRKKLTEFEEGGMVEDVVKANVVRRLLEQHDDGK